MEENKIPENAQESAGVVELSLDELNEIAGGRKIRMTEVKDWGRVYTWYNNTCDKYISARDADSLQALRSAYEAAEARYKADLAAASNDSGDILFSSYMAEWM